jgi:hypothetical protein
MSDINQQKENKFKQIFNQSTVDLSIKKKQNLLIRKFIFIFI